MNFSLFTMVAFCWFSAAIVLSEEIPPQLTLPPDVASVGHNRVNPTDEECQEWSAAMERALVNQDIDTFRDLMDLKGILRRQCASLGVALGEINADAQRAAYVKSLESGENLFRLLTTNSRTLGSTKLLRLVTCGKERFALFRMVQPKGNFRYCGFWLTKNQDGLVQASDTYEFLFGRWESEERTGLRILIRDSGVKPRIRPEDLPRSLEISQGDQFCSDARNALGVSGEDQTERKAAAKVLFDSLPRSQKQRMRIWHERICLADKEPKAEYLRIVAQCRAELGLRADLELFLVDSPRQEMIKGEFRPDWDLVSESVDRLDKAIGGDPFLDLKRADIELSRKNDTRALELATRVANAFPALRFGYDTQIRVRLARKEFEEVARLYEEKFERVGTAEPFFPFTEWPGFAAWFEKYQQRVNKRP